jgi:serine/threonine-protein kinase
MTREKLVAYLWSESDTEKARGGLKQTLCVVRQELGEKELFLGTAELRLNPAAISVDLWEFERATQSGDPAAATTAYGGPFLDGFHLTEAPEFERWVDEQRERVARRFAAQVEQLALGAMGQNDPRGAAEWWIRLTEHDPFDFRAVSGLLHALLQAGDRPRAIRYAERHMALLRKELDLTPDPEIRRLVEQARARPVPPPGD